MEEYIYTLDFLHEHNTGMCLNLHNSKGIVVSNVHKDIKSGYAFDYDNKTWRLLRIHQQICLFII